MTAKNARLMLSSKIPDFVQDVIDTGCDICAVGHDSYVIGDADIDIDKLDEVTGELQRIGEIYGDRDLLILEIVAHLRSLGRYIDDSSITHWAKNPKSN